jgi:hypothetical protein
MDLEVGGEWKREIGENIGDILSGGEELAARTRLKGKRIENPKATILNTGSWMVS